MEKFEPQYSFGILSSRQFFEKLEEEYKDFDKNHLSARHAINCALTSWHLTDWTFSEFFNNDERFQKKEILKKKSDPNSLFIVPGIKIYQDYLIKQCKELEWMRLISNGSKHCVLRDLSIKGKTSLNEGEYNYYEYNRHEYNVNVFVVNINENERLDFEETLLKTINFWKKYIKDCEEKE